MPNLPKIQNLIESDFIFEDKPINRFKKKPILNDNHNSDKSEKLKILHAQINSIEDCNLKKNSQNSILGDGNFNSQIMIIGGTPGEEEEKLKKPFQGKIGILLEKMLAAINLRKENIYSSYAINFRPPEDRKPTSNEIKRYSSFLQNHISTIDPKIIILMGSTAMESLTGLANNISAERGKWKDIIIKNTSYSIIITFSPSYLLRYPENKKYSWEDLKKIQKKIKELNINI